MKIIIAGSRTLGKQTLVNNVIISAFNKWMAEDQENWQEYLRPEIVSGGAKGVDFCGEIYAKKANLNLSIFHANWDKHGKKGGILRNIEMGNYADRLIAVWDGTSRGTKHMIEYMKSLNKPVYVYTVSQGTEEVVL